MLDNQRACMKVTWGFEGGYSNHPRDPGGATQSGVTQRVYDAYRKGKGKEPRDVRSLTPSEKLNIYDHQYWDRVQGDRLPAGVDLAVFDYAVNSGVSRASKELQRVVGTTVDGIVGEMTLTAASEMRPAEIINKLCDRRLAFLKRLKTWPTFGRGWSNRVAGVRAAALAMTAPTGASAPMPPPVDMAKPAPATGRGMESDTAQMKTPEGMGLTTAAIGAGGQALFSMAQSIQPQMGETLWGRLVIVAFVILATVGALLIGYSYYKRIKEAGGLGGYLNAKAQPR